MSTTNYLSNPNNLMALFRESGLKCRAYSGRYMYSDHCPAIILDRSGDIVKAILAIAATVSLGEVYNEMETTVETLAEALGETRSDDLGKGSVYYWPSIRFTDEQLAAERAIEKKLREAEEEDYDDESEEAADAFDKESEEDDDTDATPEDDEDRE